MGWYIEQLIVTMLGLLILIANLIILAANMAVRKEVEATGAAVARIRVSLEPNTPNPIGKV